MSAPAFCPCCGYNFREDEVVERDGFRLDPRAATVTYKGWPLRMAATPARIMHSLAVSNRAVRGDARPGPPDESWSGRRASGARARAHRIDHHRR